MLTPEQKKTCCEFMRDAGWGVFKNGAYYRIGKEDKKFTDYLLINFDLNDAALCVKVMKRRRCWMEFFVFSRKLSVLSDSWSLTITYDDFVVWLMTTKSGEAVNFFSAMAEWIEVDGKCINHAK